MEVPTVRRSACFVFAALLVAAASTSCRDNPSIDGSKVPTIGAQGAPPSCAEACDRLVALCGYAPVGCVETCEADHEDDDRLCVGQASSCQQALEECAPDEEEGEEDGEDAGAENGNDPEDAASGDAADAADA
jgi:hypothetical protein